MSTATFQAPTQGVVMGTKPEGARPDLQEIINDLIALKLMAKDGILTHRSQQELVKGLTPKEMATVARGVASAERGSVPCYERPANINTKPHPTEDGVRRFDANGKPETNFNR